MSAVWCWGDRSAEDVIYLLTLLGGSNFSRHYRFPISVVKDAVRLKVLALLVRFILLRISGPC